MRRAYKPLKGPRTLVGANKAAITTLARQVAGLQRSQIGAVQRTCEVWKFTSDITNVGHSRAFNERQPLMFAMNNFTRRSPWYIGYRDKGVTHNTVTGLPIATNTGDHFTPQIMFAGPVSEQHWKQMTPQSKYTMYNYWQGAFDDEVSHQRYLPISQKLEILFSIPMESHPTISLQPTWVRVDIFKVKKVLQTSASVQLFLPNNLASLGGMASNADLDDRNEFNPTYFTKIHTKWIKLTQGANIREAKHESVFRHTFRFENKEIRPDLDAHTNSRGALPGVGGSLVHDVLEDGYTNQEHAPQWTDKISPNDIVWCMLSTSDTTEDQTMTKVQVQAKRVITWRDPHGVAT